MTKETKMQEQQKEIIEFDVVKSDLKKVISAHKRFTIQGKNVEASPLSWIKFQITQEELILQTTDGNKALQTKLKLVDNFGSTSGCFKLSMALVSKLSFIKGKLDIIRIKKDGDNVEFYDIEYNSTQKLVVKPDDVVYPNIEKVIPTKNNFRVHLSQNATKDIASLKAPLGYIDLSLDPKNNLAVILVETNSENVSQQAILCPAIKGKDGEDKES